MLSSAIIGGAGALQYLWSTGSTNDSLTTDSNGVYILAVTDGQNCVARDTVTIVQFVGVKDDVKSSYFSLYPNPSNGAVWLQTKALKEKATVRVKNSQGQVVWNGLLPAG